MRQYAERLLIILALCSAFTACSSEGFDVSAPSLRSVTTYETDENGNAEIVSSYLQFSSALSPDGNYSFELSDPINLVWSGSLVRNGHGFYSSDDLAITNGALFSSGIYTYAVTSDRGETEEGEIVFHNSTVQPPYVDSSGILVSFGNCIITSSSQEISVQNGDAVSLSGKVTIKQKDVWGNDMISIQVLT